MNQEHSGFQKFSHNISFFSENIYNKEQRSDEAHDKHIFQSSVDRGVSDEKDEREHANGSRGRQEERDERHTEKKGQGKKVREPADSNYHTADNTPHSPLRHSTSSTMNEERKSNHLTTLQKEAEEMIAQLVIAYNDFAKREGQRIAPKDEANGGKQKSDKYGLHTGDSAHPPHVDYPQRNSHGKWQIGEIELDSEADREYINSMLEFKEMMTSFSNTDNNNAAHHS